MWELDYKESWVSKNWCFFFFFNFILFLNFTILYYFCQILKWIRHRYTCVPHPEPSSLLPPHTLPLGRPSAAAPSIQYRASNLDWRLVSYMILYMFQCQCDIWEDFENPVDCKEIQPVNPKGSQSWMFHWKDWCWSWTPILWAPDAKNWLIGKDPDAGKFWRWEEKGTTENEMAGWHYGHDGHEFE